MPLSIKELVVVLVIATVIFRLGKSLALTFMTEADFKLRRNVWLIVTSAAFLAPNYWIYALVAVPVLFIGGRKDSNPSALYFTLLYVVPPIPVPVPMIGISILFYANNFLMLAFCVIAPSAKRLLRSPDGTALRKLAGMDLCLLAYGFLHAYFFVRIQDLSGALIQLTFTGYVRNVFVFFFQIFLPYYLISRAIATRQKLTEAMASFCLACALMAGISVFESMRHWLLYGDFWSRWSDELTLSVYVGRGGSLRAMASSGHALALGYLCAIAFGFWLYLSHSLKSIPRKLAVGALFWLGLVAAYSRGPWLGAVVIYFLFAALGSNAISRLFISGAVAAVSATILSFTPIGVRIISVLPFFGGTIDSENLVYRQRLADRTLEIFADSPWFGDREAMYKMQDLRQGQGIIDIINGYSQILLDTGLVGIALFVVLMTTSLARVWHEKNLASLRGDEQFVSLGASLLACLLTSLILVGTDGMNEVLVFCVLPALCMAYARCGAGQRNANIASHGSGYVPNGLSKT